MSLISRRSIIGAKTLEKQKLKNLVLLVNFWGLKWAFEGSFSGD
jgi:hypothetical protein